MHPRFEKADRLSHDVIGAAIEVHRILGPGLLESIYEKCLLRELELRGIPVVNQEEVRIEYKGAVFQEILKLWPTMPRFFCQPQSWSGVQSAWKRSLTNLLVGSKRSCTSSRL